MSEGITELIPQLMSADHKRCVSRQMCESFDNFTKFVLFSNQLFAHYLRQLDEEFSDNSEEFETQKKQLVIAIRTKLKKVETCLRLMCADRQHSLKKVLIVA